MKKGFTLIEVMVTVVVLTVGIVSIHQALSRCLRAVRHSEEVLMCSLLTDRAAVNAQLSAWDPADKEPLSFPKPLDDKPDYSFKAITRETFTRGESTLDGYLLKTTGPGGFFSQTGLFLSKNEDKS